MYSIFDLFKVGVGPSSSHTVGPMIAAYRFANDCVDQVSRECNSPPIARVQIQLYGSLALTGAGHATDVAIIAGLSGCLPDRTDPEAIQATVRNVRETKQLKLADQTYVAFNERNDLRWLYKETLPQHPNAIQFQAFSSAGECVFEDQYFSTGGGFVYSRREFRDQFQTQPNQAERLELDTVPYPFTSAKELIELCRREGLAIDALIQINELSKRTSEEIEARLKRVAKHRESCPAHCMSRVAHRRYFGRSLPTTRDLDPRNVRIWNKPAPPRNCSHPQPVERMLIRCSNWIGSAFLRWQSTKKTRQVGES